MTTWLIMVSNNTCYFLVVIFHYSIYIYKYFTNSYNAKVIYYYSLKNYFIINIAGHNLKKGVTRQPSNHGPLKEKNCSLIIFK